MIIEENYLIYTNLILVLACGIITIFSVIITYKKNKDIFSPAKIYIFFNVFFYIDIYLNNYSTIVIVAYLLQCLLILFFSMLDFGFKITRENANTPVNAKLIFIIWLMSSISIINQFIAIHELGGIVNYISNLASRVQYFKGKGYILVLNGLIATVNVFYFAYLLSNKRINIPHWILFFIHFIIFVVMALLSGSRSFLLITILVQIICFHYIRKELTIVKLLPFVLTIVFLIALIGGIRNSFNSNGESLSFKDENVQLNSTHFKYGLIPLDIIFSSDEKPLTYGSSYLSLITNFFPRTLFPNKLDSGGIAFTKIYTNDEWGGLSNLSTGAITEAIMNFGYPIGIFVGFSSLALFYTLGIILYRKLYNNTIYNHRFYKVILYIYALLAFSRYSYSEFSYTFYTLILYTYLPLTLIMLIFKIKIKPGIYTQ